MLYYSLTILNHTILNHTILHHTLPYHTILYHTIPFFTTPHHSTPHLTTRYWGKGRGGGRIGHFLLGAKTGDTYVSVCKVTTWTGNQEKKKRTKLTG